jgi:hypothetical protein
MRPTLVFIRHLEINGRQFHHGDELPPGTLTQAEVDNAIDQGVLSECPERRSLYRLFSAFSGAKETEALTKEELTAYGLSR